MICYCDIIDITFYCFNIQNLCAICLDPLSFISTGISPSQAIFTAQCSHAFHFACISSNVRHGNITCPICRAQWTQLPRALNPPFSISGHCHDPILRILDDSIANFRVHRRSFLQSARYDDDDPVDLNRSSTYPRLDFALETVQLVSPSFYRHGPYHHDYTSHQAYLSVKLGHQQGTDLVLVVSPNGPHLRLLKQSLALVVFSLRPIDRLSIVTYSSAASRIFPLKRMTSSGKRAALQVIDRLFYMWHADPTEGLKKGIKILKDRVHKNPNTCILHLSDSPTSLFCTMNVDASIPVHQFHVGFGFGASNSFVMHEFEKFMARMLGGRVRDLQLKIGKDGAAMTIGELRGGEEKRFLLDLQGYEDVFVGYSYTEKEEDECVRTGESIVSVRDKRRDIMNGIGNCVGDGRGDPAMVCGRLSSVESWDFHDPHMARRWSKHLHGYRL